MAQFTFRLESLKKLREAERQQRRIELAEAFHAESLLHQHTSQLEQDIREVEQQSRIVSSPGRVHVDRILDTHRYKLMLKSQLMTLSQKEVQLQTEIERRRAALAASDRDVRVLEKLRERKQQEHRATELKHELLQLDESAAQRWCRDRENS